MSNKQDIDVQEFKKDIFPQMKKSPHPITDWMKGKDEKMRKRWPDDLDNLEEWMETYPTNGSGKFAHKPSNSMKSLYNCLECPELLIYIAETLGFDEDKLKKIASDALESSDDERSRCKYIREQIPWETIYDLAVKLKTN